MTIDTNGTLCSGLDQIVRLVFESAGYENEGWNSYDEMQKIEHDCGLKRSRSERVQTVGEQKDATTDSPPFVCIDCYRFQECVVNDCACTEGNCCHKRSQRKQHGREHDIRISLPRCPRRVHAQSKNQYSRSSSSQCSNQHQRPYGILQSEDIRNGHGCFS